MNYPTRWDLEQLFEGGSSSAAFLSFLEQLEQDLQQWKEDVLSATTLTENLVRGMQDVVGKLREASAFTECLEAQDMFDKKATGLGAKVKMIRATYEGAQVYIDQIMMNMSDTEWETLLATDAFKTIAFPLDERRTRAKKMLPPEQEALIADLAIDGYHGWGDAYQTAVSRLNVEVTIDGESQRLSAGQAFNYLHDENREVRKHVFDQWEKAWESQSDYCADALNRLAGFRLQVYKHRGWASVIEEPLAINRMEEKTLDAIWAAISEFKSSYVAYLNRKAKWMGLSKLAWYDVNAPLGSLSKTYTYQEAAALILNQFERFSPKMATFSERAFAEGWIEVEDRQGKRPGGFCTSLPLSEQTRIFMTFSGTADNVSTLAHELGHAYHQHVMDDMPMLLQDYAMNVAETASTLAEMIVMEATIQQATTKEEKISLLDQKIQNAVAFYMNIHARYLFETRFYALRKQGLVSSEQLDELMVEAQKEAYTDALSEYHKSFWASKLHFYITEVPFYNFPYTFGYLFSAGLYAYSQTTTDFEEKYIALLRDTGNMSVEQLAMKHLQVDVTTPAFWRDAVAYTVKDVELFLELTKEV